MDLKVFQDMGQTVWRWLHDDENNRDTLSWIAAGLLAVVGGLWKFWNQNLRRGGFQTRPFAPSG